MAQATHWFIVDGKHRYLTIGILHSRVIEYAFVDDPQRKTAERFDSYTEARDFFQWLCPPQDRGHAGPYHIIDYSDALDPGPLAIVPGPSRDELVREALVADWERYKVRARKLYDVKENAP